MEKENLTWEQIKSKYKDQYVGLTNVKKNITGAKILSADVVCSTIDSSYEELLEKAMAGEIYMIHTSVDEDNYIL